MVLLWLLLLLRLAPGLPANDEYEQIWQTAGDKAVCDEIHRIPVEISGVERLSCQQLCTTYEECGFFTIFNDGSCQIYSACNSTWTYEDPSVLTEIYKRRWADLTLLSDSCTGNDCQVAVKCPDGYWPIQCEMMAASDGLKNGNGVFLDGNMCYAKGALDGSEIHARITCRRNQKTFIALSDSIYLDQQLVAVACPVGSMTISCNCISSLAAAGCHGKFTFAPIGRMCALDIPKFPESSGHHGIDGKGVKITAICSYFATCHSHHCPSGYVRKNNAPDIVCASAVCNAGDNARCCTPATCSMQKQLGDFSSMAAMTEAGWKFQLDGPTALDNHLLKLQRCAGVFPTNHYYGLDQVDDARGLLSLKLTGRGVIYLDYGLCETDQATRDSHGALEVWLNGNLKFSSAWEGQDSLCAYYKRNRIPLPDRCSARTRFHCGKPLDWCVHNGSTYQYIDCDGDLVKDHFCYNNNGSSGFISSRYVCQSTWPHGGCQQATHGSGPIRYTDGDTLHIKGIGRTTGILIKKLNLMCTPVATSCQSMGGVDCSEELQSWAGKNTCVANVPTSGATCKEYCAQRQLSCIKGMDNDGTTCGLYREGHLRQTHERNGCLQRWADQICVCAHHPVIFDVKVTRLMVMASAFTPEKMKVALAYPEGPVFGTPWGSGFGEWIQVEFLSPYYIDSVNILDEEDCCQPRSYLVIKVDNDTCATVVRQHRNQVACQSIGKTLRFESTITLNDVRDLVIKAVHIDAVWLDLSGAEAYQSNPKQGRRTARRPIDGNSASENQCTKVSTSPQSQKAFWQINLMRYFDILAIRVAGELLNGFTILGQGRHCVGPVTMAPVDSKALECGCPYDSQILKLKVGDQREFVLCEFSVAVKVAELSSISLASTSLEDLQWPCSVQINAAGLLAKFPVRSDKNQSGMSLDLSLKTLMDDHLEAFEANYTEEEIYFCIDKCRKRVACLRVVLTSGECLLYSQGVNLSSPADSPMHQASICWAEHSLCHAEDSLECNPEIASTVIASRLSVNVPLSKSGFALGCDLSVWQSGIAIAHQDVKLSWVSVVSVGVASRRLHQQRRLGALLKQEILIEYEIVVPPGSVVPTSRPSGKFFESAFKSQIELAGLDLQVASGQKWDILDRNPHSAVDAPTPSNLQETSLQKSIMVLVVVYSVFSALVLVACIAGCRQFRQRGKATKVIREAASISQVPIGRPSFEDETDHQELDAAIMQVLPPSWTHSYTHLSKSFEQMLFMNSDQYHVFRELLNSTHRPICSQDRPCPKPPATKCRRTRGGCPCVRPGGDPGLPVEYIVRRVIRVEDSSMWSCYIQKRDLLQSKRAGMGVIKPFDPPVFTDEIARHYPDILGPLASDLNEVYLWHGTHVRGALSIAQHGFDMELAGSSGGNMYGNGIYMAESCTKADEYAKIEQEGHYDNIFALVLCRTCLGRYYYTIDREPDAVSQVEAGSFDSVCGDRAKKVHTFREMVVYDPDQAYPEYIILYSRRHEQDDPLKWQRVAAVPFHTEFPIYWVNCCKDPFHEPFCVQFRIRRDTHDTIQQLVSAACSEAGINDMTLIAARRIEDSRMWVNYSRFKRSVNARLKEDWRLSQPHELDGNSEAGHVVTTTILHRLDTGNCMPLENLDESVNELLLWHGTESRAAKMISEVGFQIGETYTHGNRFGKGTYLAEDLKKCLSYAPIETVDDIRVQYVLLCRAVCGDIFYTEQDNFSLAHQEACSQAKDCVLGNPLKRGPREFVLLDEKQVYPEFILEIEATCDHSSYVF